MKYAGLIKHGASVGRGTVEYQIWTGIRKRCNNSACRIFKYYGGKGVKVCARWDNFSNFLADMGPRPSPEHSVERRNSNGDYEPSNCYWATRKEQMRNKSDNRRITFNGVTRCVAEWSEVLGISVHTIRGRLYRGYPTEHVLKQGRHSTRGIRL